MGGKIKIESDEGIGTIVNIEIPFKVINRPPIERTNRDVRAILVASKEDRNDVQQWLQLHGFATQIVQWDGGKLSIDIRISRADIAFIYESRGSRIEDRVRSNPSPEGLPPLRYR